MKKPNQTPRAGPAPTATATSADALLTGGANGVSQDAAETAETGTEGEADTPGIAETVAEISASAAQEASRETAAVKETVRAVERDLVQERADPSYGPSGEPTSAELRRDPDSSGYVPTGGYVSTELSATGAYAGSLPATERVLPGGRAVRLTPKVTDTEEREFTAATRTMRNRKLYEIGAPIPLTRTEFETKRRCGAVREKLFDLGARLDEA